MFIYFAAATVAAVADKLAASLAEGGYLMAGHTELIGHRVRNLRSRLFAEGIVYQRCAALPVENPRPTRHATPGGGVPRVAPSRATAPRPAPAASGAASGLAPSGAAAGADDLLAAAQQLADRGDYGPAAQACRQALAVAPLAARPHFPLAQLAQLGGDFSQAGHLLEKTLYLDPGNVAAYLKLAALRERTDDPARARALRRAALQIVRALPGETLIEPYETTAATMASWLE